MLEIKRRFMQTKVIVKYLITILYCKIKREKINDVWLISERGDDARDNGYVFYRYLKNNHPEINVKFVVKKKSVDYKKIEKDDVIIYQSFKHIELFLTSKYLISTHIQGTSPEFRSFMKLAKRGMVKPLGKQIMLQHGITKDVVGILLKKNNPFLDLFICGANPEYEFILGNYGYSDNVIKLTGFARYDTLENKSKNQILLMPTWRNYLYKSSEKEFLKSEYFKRYNELINNNELCNILKELNYKLIFYPHYEVQKYIKHFKTNCENIIIADFDNYDVQELLNESKMLITDYSSVFFDFAYMKKPIIYYHFDYDRYRKTQYKPGYFDYKKNGFGEVYNNLEDLLKEIKTSSEEGFCMKAKYKNRINSFFPFCDNCNCERVYNEIINLS